MKYTIFLFAVVGLLFGGWPYLTLRQLDDALAANDHEALTKLVDIDSVRQQVAQSLERDVDSALGGENDEGSILGWLKNKVNDLGTQAIQDVINVTWTRDKLLSKGAFKSATSYAFFESWDRFLVRLGTHGDNPIHVYLQLKDWQWRVSAIHD